MAPELLVAAAMVAALVLYFLFGGADFGGGVWDLLASGPRRAQQRALIERAIGPIWEANHVWLILVVVLAFSAFPRAFAAVSIAFHVPLTLFLIGIVFRGASFAFRSFDAAVKTGAGARTRWGLGFSVASVVSPVLLGTVVGGLASGQVALDPAGRVLDRSFGAWLGAFPLATGALSLALCAYLAAVYLCHEADDAALADDFRRRALAAGAVVAGLAVSTFLLAFSGAPLIAANLANLTGRAGPAASLIQLGAAIAAGGAALALWRRRFAIARALAAAEVGLVLIGWAVAQHPYLVVDQLTLQAAAAPAQTLRLLLYALAGGTPLLVPSLLLLYRVFGKTPRTARPERDVAQL
jgi:cytochrome bd ubiquinol oxidase subunit II